MKFETQEDLTLIKESSFFDSEWYLTQYPDVKSAGVDPVEHYLRYGSAELRNPSPIFDTNWYEKNNPEVIENKMNPLVHYLKFGHMEGRIATPIEFMKRKVVLPSDVEALLEIYSLNKIDQPEKASEGNYKKVHGQWLKFFLTNAARAYFNKDYSKALCHLASAIQVCPDIAENYAIFRYVFYKLNYEDIKKYELTFAKARLLVAHISCQSRINYAKKSVDSFLDTDAEIENIIVIGDPDLRYGKFEFDCASMTLKVPAGDNYEALPQKMGQLFLFLGFTTLDLPILKIDDDIQCINMNKLKRDLDEVILKYDYGGLVRRGGPFIGSTAWHMGKCSVPELNIRPDGLFNLCDYAAGPCYWLSAASVNALSKMAIIHDVYFKIEVGFEDRAVANIMSYYGFHVYNYGLIESGGVHSVNLQYG